MIPTAWRTGDHRPPHARPSLGGPWPRSAPVPHHPSRTNDLPRRHRDEVRHVLGDDIWARVQDLIKLQLTAIIGVRGINSREFLWSAVFPREFSRNESLQLTALSRSSRWKVAIGHFAKQAAISTKPHSIKHSNSFVCFIWR